MKKIKKLIRKLILISISAIFAIWLISMFKSDIHTKLHSDEFENIQSNGVTLGDNLKIINYTDDYAKVYYTGNRYDLLTFSKLGDKWIVRTHKVVKYGEDEFSRVFVWPYFWDYII